MTYSKYLMFLFTKRNTGGNHPITLEKYDILTGEFEFKVLYMQLFSRMPLLGSLRITNILRILSYRKYL